MSRDSGFYDASTQGAMKPFATFALLYMTAIFLELSEKWRHPGFTAALLGLVVVLLVTRLTRVTFLVFLAVTTAHFVGVQFPDVANHVNLMIYCNVVMMTAIGYSLVRPGAVRSDDDWFVLVRPILQVTLILVYFLAGFHKLNADFVNPDVSCVRSTLQSLWTMVRGRVVGVPTVALLVVGTGAVAYGLFRGSPLRRQLPRLGVAALAVTLLVVVALSAPTGGALSPTSPWVVLPMVALIILWEVVGGPMLAVPALQLPVMVFSWAMHASLALINFVDFGSLALALLFTFVPPAYQELVGERVRVPLIRRLVPRPILYFALCVVVGLVNARSRVGAGLLFNGAALILLWPMLAAFLGRRPRPAWPGVPLASPLTPRWLFVFPVLLVLHASTSYVGLRTAGNFSMFSNLRTEGERSNHFLLARNPLKVWGYQEDAVRFLQIDDRQANIGYQYQRLQGQSLPVVEFRKLVYLWTRAGRTVPMTIEYQGAVYSTADIVHEPAWRTMRRDWEMRLLDFRSIQSDAPNRCRW